MGMGVYMHGKYERNLKVKKKGQMLELAVGLQLCKSLKHHYCFIGGFKNNPLTTIQAQLNTGNTMGHLEKSIWQQGDLLSQVVIVAVDIGPKGEF